MSEGTSTTTPEIETGLPLILPPHLTENFAKAETQIKKMYGVSPTQIDLIRLWLACGTSSQIRREFERTVLDMENGGLTPEEETDLDEHCF